MTAPVPSSLRVSARLRLTLSYALFLVAAGAVMLFGIYVVLRYVPNYPLTAANPRDDDSLVATRPEILGAVVGFSGIALVALAVIGIVGGWFLAGWILSPLRRINEAARIAASGDLQHRIALGGRNDEFRQVADSFDHMLDQLHDAFEVQERFAANASHELRTPLAVTSTMLDVALRDPDGQNYPALLDRLRTTNDRAIRLTESLLRLADVNAITAVAVPIELSDIVRTVIAENQPDGGRRQLTITRNLNEAPVLADETLLTQLVSNLVQNAIEHGGSSGHALVSTGSDLGAGFVTLQVESSGAVFTAEAAARLVEPFLKGAGRVAGPYRGHGLGLALVKRIAEVHGGSLRLAPRDGGGLIVTVRLPRHA